MNALKKIDSIALTRLPFALHARFHTAVYALYTAANTAKLNATAPLLAEYKACIDTEAQLVNEAKGSVETDRLVHIDSLRDADVVYIMTRIRGAMLSPVAPERTAAITLEMAMRPYVGMQTEAMDAETQHIIGMLTDFAKADIAPCLTALGLKTVVDDLKSLNNDYIAHKDTRNTAQAKKIQDNARSIRPKTDTLYKRLAELAYAARLLVTAAADSLLVDDFIGRLNALIAATTTAATEAAPTGEDTARRKVIAQANKTAATVRRDKAAARVAAVKAQADARAAQGKSTSGATDHQPHVREE